MARTSSSLTTLGLARPCVSRITWPTSAPSTPDLPPRNLATRSGLAATTVATASSSAPVSEIWARPLRFTIVLGLASVVNSSASTSLAAVADTVPAYLLGAETGRLGQAGPPLGRQLREGGAQAVHPLRRRLDRDQVRLWEVAIVHRVLLGAHRLGPAGGLVPVPRLLDELAALGQGAALPFGLVADRPVQAAERVEVLQLDLGAELGVPKWPDRDVHVEAHRALFELDVRDAERQQHRPELLGVRASLLGRAHVRLGDDLDQRDAGAVVVDQRIIRAMDPARGAHVQRLAGVLFEVDAGDPEAPHRSLDRHVQVPADAQRLVVLADLVVLRHVRIEVVLAVELRPLGDAAVQREPDPGRVLDRGAVDHRQRARLTQADRAHLGVGFGAEGRRARAEHLRPGTELDMRLDTDDRLVVAALALVEGRRHRRGSLTHGCASCRSRSCSRAWAARSISASPRTGATSCRPTGRPSTSPAGTDTAALPARFTGIVNTSDRYICTGSSTSSPMGKAVLGEVAPTSRSKRWYAEFSSRATSVRTRCACP